MQTVTFRRLEPLGAPWILTSRALRNLTEAGLRSMNQDLDRVIYESEPRNTAAAMALLGRTFEMRGWQDQVVGVFPSDHVVLREKEFRAAVQFAAEVALRGKIVTLGVRPDRPETGYGYIQADGKEMVSRDRFFASAVRRFHEKPDVERAKSFLSEGGYFWNAGIFVFQVKAFMAALRTYAPEVVVPFEELQSDHGNLAEVMKKAPSISIDYALMEKLGGTEKLACVPMDVGWSDVGSWDAVAELSPQSGDQHVVKVDAANCFVRVPEGKTVALIGVEGLRIIDTGDCLLISAKDHSQDVKLVVEELNKRGASVVKR